MREKNNTAKEVDLMGFLDDLGRKVSSDLSYQVGSMVSGGVTGTVQGALNKKGSKAKKCPKCGKPVEQEGLKFCPSCGAKLQVTCKECNIDFPAGTKFCTQCGKVLK